MKVQIPITCPPVSLRPNGSRGRSWIAREARRNQRKEAFDSARTVLAGAPPPMWAKATYRIIAHTKREWDDDNLIASLKGARDGLKDAGIVRDDKGLRIAGVEWRPAGKRAPHVVLEVEGE